MSEAVAHRLTAQQPGLFTTCSVCRGIMSVSSTPPGATLLELRCRRCGTQDIYHVNALRRATGAVSRE